METGRRTQNISLQPVEWLALRRLAALEERGNISGAVARMLDERMKRDLGRDWRQVIAAEAKRDGRAA